MPEIPWYSFEDELTRTNWKTHVSGGRLQATAFFFLFSRDLSHLLWHSIPSSELRHVGRMFDQHQRHIIDCSHFLQKQVFQKMFFMAPRVAKSVHASLANTPNVSVAALLAASPVSTTVPSDTVSPHVSSLPSPVAQPITLTPEDLGSRLDKAFDDLVEKDCISVRRISCVVRPWTRCRPRRKLP